MRKTTVATLLLASTAALAQSGTETAPLDFQAVVTSSCESLPGTKEAAPIAAILGQIAIKAVLGLATGLLEEAGKDKTITRSALAAGQLYAPSSEGNSWAPHGENCITFWYGRVGQPGGDLTYAEIDPKDPLTLRWRNVRRFVETPYVYGELRMVFSDDLSRVRLQPVRYFVRPTPDFQGFLRRSPTLAVAVDLSDVGAEAAFATAAIGLPHPVDRPTMMSGHGLIGKGTGWFSRPDPPASPPVDGQPATTGGYTVRVVATANLPGSKIAAALAGALKEDQSSLIDAIKPKTDTEKKTAAATATNAAFDALADVAKAQAEYDAAAADKKPEMLVRLQQARYKADVALEAAGLPKRFNVQP